MELEQVHYALSASSPLVGVSSTPLRLQSWVINNCHTFVRMFYSEDNYVTCDDCKDGLGRFPDAVQRQKDDIRAELKEYCGSSFQGFVVLI